MLGPLAIVGSPVEMCLSKCVSLAKISTRKTRQGRSIHQRHPHGCPIILHLNSSRFTYRSVHQLNLQWTFSCHPVSLDVDRTLAIPEAGGKLGTPCVRTLFPVVPLLLSLLSLNLLQVEAPYGSEPGREQEGREKLEKNPDHPQSSQ